MEANELELYGVSELAARWGITRQGAAKFARNNLSLPKELACGPVWTGDQVREYEARRDSEN
jgi:hypothetical protein